MPTEWQWIRLPKQLYGEVSKAIQRHQFWPTEHEFVRDAVREKLELCTKTSKAQAVIDAEGVIHGSSE